MVENSVEKMQEIDQRGRRASEYLDIKTNCKILMNLKRIINTLDVTGISALVKLYDKITNAFEYQMKIGSKTKKMTREELTNYVRHTNPKIRETAYKTILGKYNENKGVVGEIYQNIALNWKDEGIDIRGYKTPISMRNIGNDVDDKTIESLLLVCRKRPVFKKFLLACSK